MTASRIAAALTVCVLGGAALSSAQETEAHRLRATRTELEELLRRLDRPEQAIAVDRATRGRLLAEAAAVRTRLADGDFVVGDRILLIVEGDPAPPTDHPGPVVVRSVEQQLSDTFTVGSQQELTLPVIGVVPLRGVLRAELESYLTSQIGQFIQNPVVHAQPLVRVSIVGQVAKPGFYSVPTNAVLAAALMAAGGPTQDANLPKMRVERSGQQLWSGDQLRQAIAEGRTVDDIGLRPGDAFIIPRQRRGDPYDAFRLVAVLLSIPVTVYTLGRIF